MTRIEELKQIIEDSGMTMISISKKSGIERATLYNRLKGQGDFTAKEIVGLSDALRLTAKQRDHIFLGKELN